MTAPLDAALDFARRGFFVFPALDKRPAIKDFPNRATRDPEQIRKWFSVPGRNVAIYTGRFQEHEALLAVDVDIRQEKDGSASLLALELEGCDLPETLTHTTPHGRHYIYRVPAGVKQGTNVLGPGVDTRSAGGYIIAPGSTVAGLPYLQVNGHSTPEPAPNWLLARVGGVQQPRTSDPAPVANVDVERAEDRARDYLTNHAPLAVQGQGGDQTTFKVAARLKDLGVPETKAVELMAVLWNDRCSPPWALNDLAVKVLNSFRYTRDPQGSVAPEAAFEVVESSSTIGDAPAERAGVARHLRSLRWSDLRGVPVPPARWIWKPFLPHVPFGVLASHPGHGKSLLSLQVAVSIATGLPLFGHEASGPAGVGVLALEDDQNVIHRRLAAVVQSYPFEWTAAHDDLLDRNLRIMVRGRTDAEQAGALHLAGLVREIGAEMQTTQDPPAALFVDTLNSIHAGDENSNTEVRELVAAIFQLHDSLGCSVWALHHLRKSGTGRNAPALHDRLDPELVRGAGALVASARAVIQFGWITSNEAAKADLPTENAHRRFAILALTKVNDGALSPWLLIEHSERQGLWAPAPGGERKLAVLRGGNALEKLSKAEELLLAIHESAGNPDREDLAARFFPADSKASAKLKSSIQDMRRRKCWLQPVGLDLTEAGAKKVLELKGRQASEGAYQDDEESSVDAGFLG